MLRGGGGGEYRIHPLIYLIEWSIHPAILAFIQYVFNKHLLCTSVYQMPCVNATENRETQNARETDSGAERDNSE